MGPFRHRVQQGCSHGMSTSGGPSIIRTGRFRMRTSTNRRTRWPISLRCSRHVGNMPGLPFAGNIRFLGWRDIDSVMQPSIPPGRYAGSLDRTFINNPAALMPQSRIRFAATRAIISVAEFVLTNQLALSRREKPRANRLAIPPREELKKEVFHWKPSETGLYHHMRHRPAPCVPVMPSLMQPVQHNSAARAVCSVDAAHLS